MNIAINFWTNSDAACTQCADWSQKVFCFWFKPIINMPGFCLAYTASLNAISILGLSITPLPSLFLCLCRSTWMHFLWIIVYISVNIYNSVNFPVILHVEQIVSFHFSHALSHPFHFSVIVSMQRLHLSVSLNNYSDGWYSFNFSFPPTSFFLSEDCIISISRDWKSFKAWQ